MSAAVVRSIAVHATATDAFDAFTRVSDLLSWLCEGALVGLRPGGNWAVGFTDRAGMTEATVLGKIADFERGRRLVVEDISYEPRERRGPRRASGWSSRSPSGRADAS